MKKWKRYSVLGLVALVIILCGMLPGIVAKIGDNMSVGPTYVEFKSLQFNQELSDLEKMYLVTYGNKVDASADTTSLESEEVIAMALSGMEPYFNAELISQPLDSFEIEICKPMLCYSNVYSQNKLSSVFWVVHMVNEGADEEAVSEQMESNKQYDEVFFKEEITLWLDEASGKIVWIQYYNEGECYKGYELGEKALAFYTLFIEDKEFESAESDIYISEFEDSPYLYYVSYSIENAIYGNIHLEFHTMCTGFEVKYYSGNMQF